MGSCAFPIPFDIDTPGPLSIQPFVLSASSMRPTPSFYGTQIETKMGSPISPSQHQASALPSSAFVPRAVSSEFSPSSAGDRETGRLTRSQVQRLQILIQDFNREINITSPDRENAGFDSARVTELHGRIAELTRAHTERGDVSEDRRASPFSQTGLPPPAYEADPRQVGYLGQTKAFIR
jgi:hypothetical protein